MIAAISLATLCLYGCTLSATWAASIGASGLQSDHSMSNSDALVSPAVALQYYHTNGAQVEGQVRVSPNLAHPNQLELQIYAKYDKDPTVWPNIRWTLLGKLRSAPTMDIYSFSGPLYQFRHRNRPNKPKPSLSDQPAQPDFPKLPSEPDFPKQPSEPDFPKQPSEPDHPKQPSEPDHPEQPSEPDHPEQPSEPDVPKQPSETDFSKKPAEEVSSGDHEEQQGHQDLKDTQPLLGHPNSTQHLVPIKQSSTPAVVVLSRRDGGQPSSAFQPTFVVSAGDEPSQIDNHGGQQFSIVTDFGWKVTASDIEPIVPIHDPLPPTDRTHPVTENGSTIEVVARPAVGGSTSSNGSGDTNVGDGSVGGNVNNPSLQIPGSDSVLPRAPGSTPPSGSGPGHPSTTSNDISPFESSGPGWLLSTVVAAGAVVFAAAGLVILRFHKGLPPPLATLGSSQDLGDYLASSNLSSDRLSSVSSAESLHTIAFSEFEVPISPPAPTLQSLSSKASIEDEGWNWFPRQ
ncbi:hypothetical protein BSLG_000112 [Batrachochytrium salamandrivorans]|nr:hypothetical protein BSLG_000112 [Batrachochytrium salamandrivorans]